MNRFVKIGKAAELLGISIQTLRRWEANKTLVPTKKTAGGTRYYNIDKILSLKKIENDLTIAYARVSSHDQKKDLDMQAKLLSSEEELAKDVLEIITVFSARLYGSRSRKNKKLLETLTEAVNAI